MATDQQKQIREEAQHLGSQFSDKNNQLHFQSGFVQGAEYTLSLLPNCLGYALRFWEHHKEYKLYYGPGHVINSPMPIETKGWLPAEDYGYDYFSSSFAGLLCDHETKLLKQYFNYGTVN